jgi:hypothetical protein
MPINEQGARQFRAGETKSQRQQTNGQANGTTAPHLETLLAVCDVLVMKSLEKLGNFIVRVDRSRYRQLADSGRPAYAAHAIWPATDEMVSKALKNAWDVVPYVVDTYARTPNTHLASVLPVNVITVLDRYVHDLAITGNEHDLAELAYRMRTYLRLQVWAPPMSQVQPPPHPAAPEPELESMQEALFTIGDSQPVGYVQRAYEHPVIHRPV